MDTSPETRHSLVRRLQNAADHEAWTEFVAIYEPLLYRVIGRYRLQDCDARDVCQQVLQAVGRDIEKWQPDGKAASFRRWLFQIARNRAIKTVVAERKRRGVSAGGTSAQVLLESQPDDFTSQIEQHFDHEYRIQRLQWAAEQIRGEFREKTWVAFWETHIKNRSVAEVAEELSMSHGSVYVARSRVVARLRERVRVLEDD